MVCTVTCSMFSKIVLSSALLHMLSQNYDGKQELLIEELSSKTIEKFSGLIVPFSIMQKSQKML